jgi:hypothetical protein
MKLNNNSCLDLTVPKLSKLDFSIFWFIFSASLVSGFLSSFVSLPFDNAKTKIQKMKKDKNGVFPYKNIFDAMQKTVVN